jgi:hypothetical protein
MATREGPFDTPSEKMVFLARIQACCLGPADGGSVWASILNDSAEAI